MPEPVLADARPDSTLQLDIQGYPLSYIQRGSGRPLILIHGSLCDYRYWRWQVPALSENYRVLAPSLRGYWPSNAPSLADDFSVQRHASDLAALLARQNAPEGVHVLGHSRGAHVALELACQAPELVRSLILADPGFQTSAGAGSGSHAFQREVASRLAQGDIDGALAEFIDTVNGAGTWRQMVGWFKTMVRDNAQTLPWQAAEALAPDAGFDPQRARNISCATLLLGGQDSPPRYGQIMDILQMHLQRAERDVIPRAAHGMNLANAKAFNARVIAFVSGVDDHG